MLLSDDTLISAYVVDYIRLDAWPSALEFLPILYLRPGVLIRRVLCAGFRVGTAGA